MEKTHQNNHKILLIYVSVNLGTMCGNGFGVLHKRRFFHINEGFFNNMGLSTILYQKHRLLVCSTPGLNDGQCQS